MQILKCVLLSVVWEDQYILQQKKTRTKKCPLSYCVIIAKIGLPFNMYQYIYIYIFKPYIYIYSIRL